MQLTLKYAIFKDSLELGVTTEQPVTNQ